MRRRDTLFFSDCRLVRIALHLHSHELTSFKEIRAQIFGYLLPYSLPPTQHHQVTWVRGSLAPLLINKELCNEAIDLLYGSNTFKLYVTYEGIWFRFSWLLPSGLRPNLSLAFPDAFHKDYLSRIRHVLVIVEQVDSYKGMIKYNCGGRGLNEGVRNQIQRLVDILSTNPHGLGRVTVRLEGNPVLEAIKGLKRKKQKDGSGGVDQSVLEPFGCLHNVDCPSFDGCID